MIDLSDDVPEPLVTCSWPVSIGVVVLFKKSRAASGAGRQWDRFKLQLPMGIGDIVRKIAVARFVAHARHPDRRPACRSCRRIEITGQHRRQPRDRGRRWSDVVERVKEGESIAGPLASLGVSR